MLGSAMSVIDEVVPLAQAFTSWPVVRFMWSLEPQCRTDEVYLHVLRNLDAELLEIPWARTGRPYLCDDQPADDLKRSFHDYGAWTRVNLHRIQEAISRGRLQDIGPFNPAGLKAVVDTFSRFSFVRSGRLLEIVLWLASLALLMEKYGLEAEMPRKSRRLRAINRFELMGTVFRQFRATRRSV
jgi:asparagine synthase (glutamine-hydrolysing)